MPTAKTLLSASLAATTAPPALAPGRAKSKSKSWLDVEALPPVRRMGGDVVATSELAALLDGFAAGSRPESDTASAAFAEFDPTDVDAFALAMAEAWVRAKGPADATWAITAAGRVGGRATTRALALWTRKFARERSVAAAVLIVDALAESGTRGALIELKKLEHAPKEVADAAEKRVQKICEERGLDAEDVEDLVVPECSLGAGEVLDFGARTFRVDFDADFTPIVRDAAGERLANLPRAGKKDDAAKSAAATERWSELKTLLRDTLRGESKRFEWAMCAERRWSVDRFRAAILGHPLLVRLAARLLWAAEVDGASTYFRIAEDRTLADAADAPLVLPTGAEVSIPHALHVGPDVRASWGTIFADYAIIPPFPQLGRETYVPTDAELRSTVLERFDGVWFSGRAGYALEGHGWVEGDDYHDLCFVHVLPDGTEATANLGTKWDNDRLRHIHVQVNRKLGEMDPVSFSELCRDIYRLPQG